MNKKDIANIRKQFKLDNYRMKIQDIFNVYVKKETGEIYQHISQPFYMLEKEAQELFLVNFKKVLTGSLDSKLFELKFRHNVEYSTQTILYEGLHMEDTEDWNEQMLQIVEKMFAQTVYEFDTVVTFIRAEYRKPTRKRSLDTEEGGDDETYASPLILCSLNKIDQPKKTLLFDFIERTFKANNVVDPIINLAAPLTGFLFPAFNDNAADVNHILYFSGKANQPDFQFIEEVLNCEEIITAQEDKDIFDHILKEVIGDKVDSDVISNVYGELDRMISVSAESEDEEDKEVEPPMLDSHDIEQLLTASGVEDVRIEQVEHAMKSVLIDEKHEFKANNLVPKTIKIDTKVAKLTLSPKDLKHVKYIMFQGKRCLVLEIDEDVEVEGLKLETKTL
ncbi:DUF4317 domain-containing protein [Caldibacillus lycopersici]|uniref:DUF4317 domain-containing protein n=1 Tax=Perspicuibacillus lycopersici TaxID=1325689 RepID=A0AAE3IR20_9BACI|nr:DUF4317 domain-containing protein [Perspicuibacillus lycopersici]MCU9612617.1 DUF4317 domain-containing protein [Perspicuibacillus lycopersici]